MTEPRGLLAIFAHPDDESFGVGGVLAQAASAGIPVHLICTTDGDLGGTEDNRDLGRDLRRGELREAMTALGVGEPIFLGYGDSGMENWPRPAVCYANADREDVITRLVAIIRELRPNVVLTFDPGGIYGHPDHVTVSAHATEAYRRASIDPDGPTVLYHQAIARSAVERMNELQQMLASVSPDPPAAAVGGRRAPGPPLPRARPARRPGHHPRRRPRAARRQARRPRGPREPDARQPLGGSAPRDGRGVPRDRNLRSRRPAPRAGRAGDQPPRPRLTHPAARPTRTEGDRARRLRACPPGGFDAARRLRRRSCAP